MDNTGNSERSWRASTAALCRGFRREISPLWRRLVTNRASFLPILATAVRGDANDSNDWTYLRFTGFFRFYYFYIGSCVILVGLENEVNFIRKCICGQFWQSPGEITCPSFVREFNSYASPSPPTTTVRLPLARRWHCHSPERVLN